MNFEELVQDWQKAHKEKRLRVEQPEGIFGRLMNPKMYVVIVEERPVIEGKVIRRGKK
jgi:hypothetical protein